MESIINRFCEEKKIEVLTRVYYDGEELIEEGEAFDIIFLDVEMPKMDGIHTAKLIRKQNVKTKIIYITGYSQYMRNAFTVHAFDYLRKPFKTERVEQALEEVIDYIDRETKNSSVTILFKHGPRTFQTQDIYYLERYKRRVKLITAREEIEVQQSLEALLNIFQEKGFEASHKSFIVNLFYVQSIKGFQIEMKDGKVLPLAQKRAADFKKRLYDYLHEAYHII